MRTIKFRGKKHQGVLPNGEVLRGGFVYGSLVVMPNGDCHILGHNGTDAFNNYKVLPDTIGQLTTYRDRRGKEIYEGDVLECLYNTPLFPIRERVSVAWRNDEFEIQSETQSLTLRIADVNLADFVVVGTIHDDNERKQD